jgi:Skp family chaperone for outer membrane proteins
MHRSIAIAFLGVALIVAGMVTADANPTQQKSSRIGFVNLERTLLETPAGKRASEQWEKARKLKQSELDKKQKDFQELATQLEKQRTVLKPEVL